MNPWMKRQDGEIVKITAMDFRSSPGSVFEACQQGVTFVVTHMGREVAVVQSLRSSGLTLHALADGSMTYAPPKKRQITAP